MSVQQPPPASLASGHRWSSSFALVAATLCAVAPYLAALVGSLSIFGRIALATGVYVAVSAHSQRRSVQRFQMQQTSSPSKHTEQTNLLLPQPSRATSPRSPRAVSNTYSGLQRVEASSKDTSVAEKVAFIRSEQCPQLMDACYLDAAAAPPFPTGLVRAVAEDLSTRLLSNPHSKSPSAIATADQITATRLRVMRELFGIQDTHNWHLVFTAGTTASLKLVGESIDWNAVKGSDTQQARFAYHLQSHTSVVGIRDLATRAGAVSSAFSEHDADAAAGKSGLIALPLQCNATGRRYLDLMKHICRTKADESLVLVDAASYLSSASRLDLSQMQTEETPDMIAFSFYKIFGYPTGIGGLLVKASAAPRLSRKTYFGGGTVDAILAESAWTKPRREFEARFEDGTVNVHGILAVNRAMDYYTESFGSWADRLDYVAGLRDRLISALKGLRHGNGVPVVRMYPAASPEHAKLEYGPIVNFNLLTATGAMVPPQEVDRLASISNIHVRMGRHCNPGFVTSHLGIAASRLKQEYAEGAGCDDAGDAALEVSGLASASVRASLCLLNTEEDVERLVGFVARFFLSPHPSPSTTSVKTTKEALAGAAKKRFELANITVYPIKSCAGHDLARGEAWTLTRHGLAYDREWIVMNLANGKALSQKRFPKMALIRPRIDLVTRQMAVSIAGTSRSFKVSLDDDMQYNDGESVQKEGKATEICGMEVWPRAHRSEELRVMLTALLGVSCTLARQATDVSRHSKLDTGSDKVPLIFSNESPFLMINSASVAQVSEWMQSDSTPVLTGAEEVASDSGYSSTSHSKVQPKQAPALFAQAASFRANFMIAPERRDRDEDDAQSEAFSEDAMSRLVVGGRHVFGVLGQCRRCQMVCVDQKTGEVKPQTLKTLAKLRRNDRGRIIFGSHLMWLPDLAPTRTEVGHPAHQDDKVWVGMDVVAS